MITKRQNVFETNSSSSHSLTIKSGENWDTITPDQDGVIYLYGDEFGWGWDKHNDALTKANYYAVDNQYNEEKLELLKKVIQDYTNCDVVIEINDSSYAYIDHESCGTTNQIYTEDDLRQFIFNKASWLFIGNDNGCAPNKFYDDPSLPYTHKVIIELPGDDPLVWDLQSYPEDIQSVVRDMISDVRFNATKNIWENRPHYWSGSELYFDYCWGSFNEEDSSIKMTSRDSDKEIILNYKIIKL